MEIKELKRLCDLRRNIVMEAIRIEKEGNKKENARRLQDYCYRIASMFPASGFLNVNNRSYLIDFIANKYYIAGNYSPACEIIEADVIRERIIHTMKSVLLSIATDYKENYLDFE